MPNNTINFGKLDTATTITDGDSTFRILARTSMHSSSYNYNAEPPTLIYPGGMEGRFLHIKGIVESLLASPSFLTKPKHEFLDAAAMLAIVAVETGPRASGDATSTGMIFITPDVTSTYNPRSANTSLALNVPQVTRITGEEFGNDIKDPWNYAESIRGAINHFNVTMYEVSVPTAVGVTARDATLLTAAMGYNAGFGTHRTAKTLWNIQNSNDGPFEPRIYAGVYYQAFNQIVNRYYKPQLGIDYDKFVNVVEQVPTNP